MRTVFWEDNQLKMIDQGRLPGVLDVVAFTGHAQVAQAIRDMVVPPPRNVTLWNSTEVVGTLSAQGVPDYVQVISLLLEYWYQRYIAAGFRDPCKTNRIQVDFSENLGPGVLGAGGIGYVFLRADLTDIQMQSSPVCKAK